MEENSKRHKVVIDDAIRLQCKIRGIQEDEVLAVLRDALECGYSEGDGRGFYRCKGSPRLGKTICICYCKPTEDTVVVVEASEL